MIPADPTVGLCATCRLRRVIRSRRGSAFWYCRLSDENPQFPKYPKLPVLECSGHVTGAADQEEGS